MIPFSCMMCGTWTVHVEPEAVGESWTGPGGETAFMVAGRCETCGSKVMIDPSEAAVELTSKRLDAMRKAVRAAVAGAGDG